jgi:hypothetical protein
MVSRPVKGRAFNHAIPAARTTGAAAWRAVWVQTARLCRPQGERVVSGDAGDLPLAEQDQQFRGVG